MTQKFEGAYESDKKVEVQSIKLDDKNLYLEKSLLIKSVFDNWENVTTIVEKIASIFWKRTPLYFEKVGTWS